MRSKQEDSKFSAQFFEKKRPSFLFPLFALALLFLLTQNHESKVEPLSYWLDLPFERDDRLSLHESVQLYLQISQWQTELGSASFTEYEVPTLLDMEQWLDEVGPYFLQEGFASELQDLNELSFESYSLEESNTFGKTYCEDDVITMNSRFTNSYAIVSQTPLWFWILTHEAAHHYAHICGDYVSEYDLQNEALATAHLEISANIMALEVLAAMARDGNIPALHAFLFGLRTLSLNNVIFLAQDQRAFSELQQEIPLTAEHIVTYSGLFDLQQRHRNLFQEMALLRSMALYGYEPMDILFEASQDVSQTTERLYLFDGENDNLTFGNPVVLEQTLQLLEQMELYLERAVLLQNE